MTEEEIMDLVEEVANTIIDESGDDLDTTVLAENIVMSLRARGVLRVGKGTA